ncbi:hypothetical protein HDV01_006826 [Terramyces sp. JEL0728]|nr:hypothetical protein HDV01_006826 [Terramyces sp. JEL0728]
MTGTSLSEFTKTFNEDEINMGYMRYTGKAIFVHYIPEKESDRIRAYSLLHAKKCTQQFFPLVSAKITLESLQQFDSNFVKDTLVSCEPLKGKKNAASDIRFTILANNQGLNELLSLSESNKEFQQLMDKKELPKPSELADAQSSKSREASVVKVRDISTSVVKNQDISTSVVRNRESDADKPDTPTKLRESEATNRTRDSESKMKDSPKKSSNTDVSAIKYPKSISKVSLGSLSGKSSGNNSSEKVNSPRVDEDAADHKSMQVFWDEMKNKLAVENGPPETNSAKLKNFVTKSAVHAQNIFGRSSSSESLKGSKAANAVIMQHKQKQVGVVPNDLIKFPKSSPLNSLSKATGSAQSLPNLIEISVEPPSPSKDPKAAPIVYDNDQIRLRRHSADKQMLLKNDEAPQRTPETKAMPFKSHRTIGKSVEDINIDDLLKTPPNEEFPEVEPPKKESVNSPVLRRNKTESSKRSNENPYFREMKNLPELPTKTIDSIINARNQPGNAVNSPIVQRKEENRMDFSNEEELQAKPTITKSILTAKTVSASNSRERLSPKEQLNASKEKVAESKEKLAQSIDELIHSSGDVVSSREKITEPRSGMSSRNGSKENLRPAMSKENLTHSNSNLPAKLALGSPKDELRRTPTLSDTKGNEVVFNIHKGGQLRNKNGSGHSTSPSSPTPVLVDKSKTVKNRQIQLHEQWVQFQAPSSELVEKRWIRLQKGYLTLFFDDQEVSPLLHISLDQPTELVDCAYGKYPGICLQSAEGEYKFYSMDEKNRLKRILTLARKWA